MAKKIFSSCAKGVIDCSTKNLLLSREPTHTQILHTPVLKLSEYVDIIENGNGACTNPGHPYTNAKMLYETGTWNYLHLSGKNCGVDEILATNLDTQVPLTAEFQEKYHKIIQ